MLDKLLRLPGVYQVLAFLLARRALVRGPSMFPTLAPGEYVLFDRLAYRRAPPRGGDVVLAAAEKLLGQVNQFAEAFWKAKGVETRKVSSNQAAGGEYVVPAA